MPLLNFSAQPARMALARQIESAETSFPLLHLLLPQNEREQRALFLNGVLAEPTFTYAPVALPDLPAPEDCTDGPMGALYADRFKHCHLTMRLLALRGTDDTAFSRVSQQLFPVQEVPETLYDMSPPLHHGTPLSPEDVRLRFAEALTAVGLHDWDARLLPLASALTARTHECVIGVSDECGICDERIDCFIRHEIVHALRYSNGRRQNEPLLRIGTRQGKLLEEGVTIHYERPPDLYRFSVRHQLVRFALHHTFRETWERARVLGLSDIAAWKAVLRVKRGLKDGRSHGAFTKDAIYLQGHHAIRQWAAAGNDVSRLLCAQIAPEELSLVSPAASTVSNAAEVGVVLG